MTMVGGFDVRRKQITFDYVNSDGLVRWREIRPATRKTLRGWLGEHCPDGDAEFGLEGCTGWPRVLHSAPGASHGERILTTGLGGTLIRQWRPYPSTALTGADLNAVGAPRI
jgi:hypothetical protein